jgi:hypothetical protein
MAIALNDVQMLFSFVCFLGMGREGAGLLATSNGVGNEHDDPTDKSGERAEGVGRRFEH